MFSNKDGVGTILGTGSAGALTSISLINGGLPSEVRFLVTGQSEISVAAWQIAFVRVIQAAQIPSFFWTPPT